MLLTQDIIRKLIKEELQNSLNLEEDLSLGSEDMEQKVDSIVSSLSNIDKSQQIQILRKAEEKLREPVANRKDDYIVGEKLGKDATAGDYVKDFRKSDAPQFKGKSKKKKQQMAVAAYLDAKEKDK